MSGTFAGGTDYLQCGAVTPEGRIVIAGGQDSVLRVWNGTNGERIGFIDPPKADGPARLLTGGRKPAEPESAAETTDFSRIKRHLSLRLGTPRQGWPDLPEYRAASRPAAKILLLPFRFCLLTLAVTAETFKPEILEARKAYEKIYRLPRENA